MPGFLDSLVDIGLPVLGNILLPGVGGLIGTGLAAGYNALTTPSQEEQYNQMISDAIARSQGMQMPGYQQILSSTVGPINAAYNKRQIDLISQLAGTGLNKSGVGISALNELNQRRGQDILSAERAVNEENLQYQQNALNRLLGLGEGQLNRSFIAEQQQGQALGSLFGNYLTQAKDVNFSLPPGWGISDSWNMLTHPSLWSQLNG